MVNLIKYSRNIRLYLTIFLILVSQVNCGGNADNLVVGDDAPNFSLEDSHGNVYNLSDYQGKAPVIIYFYPKANTSGCTKQACGIRDDYPTFKENNIVVFGISVDSKEDIRDFEKEYNLNFPLLSDENKSVAKTYGVLNNLGIASRITFIVDKKGKIANIIKSVDIDNHAKQVLELAKNLL